MINKFSEVFKPGTFPEMTYVSRHSKHTQYTYEERLKQSLAIDGYLTYIVGPSKIGKTVLCESVIGQRTRFLVRLRKKDWNFYDSRNQ